VPVAKDRNRREGGKKPSEGKAADYRKSLYKKKKGRSGEAFFFGEVEGRVEKKKGKMGRKKRAPRQHGFSKM